MAANTPLQTAEPQAVRLLTMGTTSSLLNDIRPEELLKAV
jgi:hypothetical protein